MPPAQSPRRKRASATPSQAKENFIAAALRKLSSASSSLPVAISASPRESKVLGSLGRSAAYLRNSTMAGSKRCWTRYR